MKFIQYSYFKRETYQAEGKGKSDVYDIALEMGFAPSYRPMKMKYIRVLQQILTMRKIKQADVLLVQYPAIMGVLQKMIYKIVRKDTVLIALVHDLNSIRMPYAIDKETEIRRLNRFEYLIVHNRSMEAYLRELGYSGKLICLDIFDYLHDEETAPVNEPFSNTVIVAGNLTKVQYTLELGKVGGCKFNLFGIKEDMDFSQIENVEYKGVLTSAEIVYKITGDYGLVWDGESIDGCTGYYGEYLRYNNPHKLSLYMACGKPVIVWKQSAVAEFVGREQVGICVDSLEELNDIDLYKDFEKYKRNAMYTFNQIWGISIRKM